MKGEINGEAEKDQKKKVCRRTQSVTAAVKSVKNSNNKNKW